MTTPVLKAYENLLIERTGAVTVLKVHRPDVLNALNRETLAEIDDAARAFIEDDEQGALIVTGSGEKSFISGADINELAVLGPAAAEEISRFGQSVLDVLERSPKPVIAKLNRELRAVMAGNDVIRQFTEAGGDMKPGSPEEMTRHVAEEIAKWRRVVKERNIEVK